MPVQVCFGSALFDDEHPGLVILYVVSMVIVVNAAIASIRKSGLILPLLLPKLACLVTQDPGCVKLLR